MYTRPGEQWVWGQLPGGGVLAGWGWVTVISCPQAAAVVSCRCRWEGAGVQAGLPGDCWAPTRVGILAAVCPSPRISAEQGPGCSMDKGRWNRVKGKDQAGSARVYIVEMKPGR